MRCFAQIKSPRRKPGDTGSEHRPTCHADPGTPTDAVSPDFRPGLFVKRVSRLSRRVKLAPKHTQRVVVDRPLERERAEDGVEQFVAGCILDGGPHDLSRGDA